MATPSPADPPSRSGSQPTEAEARLCDLAPGERGRVTAVEPAADPGGRLGDLGFLPGTVVTLVRRAPLGDPAVYALRGTRFCLRRTQAAAVSVARLGPAPGPSPGSDPGLDPGGESDPEPGS